MKLLKDIDEKHDQRAAAKRWEDMNPLQKAWVYLKWERWRILTWLWVPVGFPNWLLYTAWLRFIHWRLKTGMKQTIDITTNRLHTPSVACGASLWLNLYFLIRSWL